MKQIVISILFGALAASATYAAGLKILGEATLESPVAQAKEAVIKGVNWRCEGAKCVGTARDWPGLDGFMKRCSTVSASIGPLATFQTGGRIMSKSEIATCNRLAGK
jgi:hypothetical protein